MQPTRCHITSIFENGIKSFAQALPVMIIPLTASGLLQKYWHWMVPAILLVLALLVFYQVWRWRRTWLYTEADQLVIQSGVFWKKKLAIPFEKINTVDLSRNLIERVLGTCRIQIDTGVTTKSGSEVDLVFKLAQAEGIRSQVLALSGQVDSLHDDFGGYPQEGNPAAVDVDGTFYARAEAAPAAGNANGTTAPRQKPSEYRAGIREFVLYGLTQSKMLKVVALMATGYAFLENTIGSRLYALVERIIQPIFEEASRQAWTMVLAVSLALILAVILIANGVTIVITVVRFFNFRASRIGEHIHIEYGLITAKSYTIPVKNIRAVVIEQNLLRQLTRQASVEIVSIGYGDDKNEIALLLPLIARRQAEVRLQELLPEWAKKVSLHVAPRPALRRFFLLPFSVFLALWAALCFGLVALEVYTPWIWLAFSIIALILAASRYLHYRHAALGYSEDQIDLRQGGFTCRYYRVAIKAVQSVGTFSHPIMERANLRNYFIDYHAPALKTRIQVRFLHQEHLSPLRSLLEKSDMIQEDVRL